MKLGAVSCGELTAKLSGHFPIDQGELFYAQPPQVSRSIRCQLACVFGSLHEGVFG
jgi:hypothetical protein